jgi:hypothetical protein
MFYYIINRLKKLKFRIEKHRRAEFRLEKRSNQRRLHNAKEKRYGSRESEAICQITAQILTNTVLARSSPAKGERTTKQSATPFLNKNKHCLSESRLWRDEGICQITAPIFLLLTNRQIAARPRQVVVARNDANFSVCEEIFA